MKAIRAMVLALGGLVAAGCATAGHDYRGSVDYDWAEVLEAEPIVEHVRVPVSREVCWDEEVHYTDRGRGSAAGTILGGLIGGVAGHQIGSGSGNTAATVVGTLAGAAIGSRASSGPPRHYSSVEERCRLERAYRSEERLQGYRVTYLYNGQTYTTRTRHDPGSRIRVRVSVSPAE